MPAKLTPAQERVLLVAFTLHPATYVAGDARVPRRLCELGLLRATDAEAAARSGLYQLTPAGLEAATELSARRVVEAVAAPRQPGSTAAPRPFGPRAPGQPAQWPFPVSLHKW